MVSDRMAVDNFIHVFTEVTCFHSSGSFQMISPVLKFCSFTRMKLDVVFLFSH